MGIAKVTRNNQITIPADIRRVHGIKEGDTLLFVTEGGNVHLVRMGAQDAIKAAAGAWKGKIKNLQKWLKDMRKEWDTRSL